MGAQWWCTLSVSCLPAGGSWPPRSSPVLAQLSRLGTLFSLEGLRVGLRAFPDLSEGHLLVFWAGFISTSSSEEHSLCCERLDGANLSRQFWCCSRVVLPELDCCIRKPRASWLSSEQVTPAGPLSWLWPQVSLHKGTQEAP